MARSNKLEKTSKQNIYKTTNSSGKVEYLVTFTFRGRRYVEKNLTTIFGVKNLTEANNALTDIKSALSKGEDPFNIETDKEHILFNDLIENELKDRKISENTRATQLGAFKKHAEKLFNKINIQDINIDLMERIFKKLSENVKQEVLTTIKKAINPTLNSAYEKGIIKINPLTTKTLKNIKGTITKKKSLSNRLNAPINKNIYQDTVRSIYKSIMEFENIGRIPTNEIRLCLLWALMTARRRSEILKIEYEDIIADVVKVRSEISKTDMEDEFYPLPKEILDLLEKTQKGKIFKNVTPNTYSKYMKKVILNAGVDTTQISGHDTRNLFLTIMSKKTKNPFLCDMCLSHRNKEYAILMKYYTPDLEDFREVFNDYWKILRN